MIEIKWSAFRFILILVTIQVKHLSAAASSAPNFPVPERFKGGDLTIFNKLKGLVDEYKPIDLGQGSPDFLPAKVLTKNLKKIVASKDYSLSQYSPDSGQPRLQRAIARLYSRLINRTLDPEDNVLITVGATEALFDTFQTHTFPGDEWIVMQPSYDSYIPMIIAAQGTPRLVPLKPTRTNRSLSSADWTFDRCEMASMFNEKTKGIVINTPHNPLGKMFNREELSFIAELARKWNTLVLSDEVYQFMTFDENEHIRIVSLPGMFERTITIGSAGKTFCATGYRIGWVYGEKNLLKNLKTIHTNAVLSAPTPFQEAIAMALEEEMKNYGAPSTFFESLRRAVAAKRDYVADVLTDFGMEPIIPEGGYYLVANWTTLDLSFDEGTEEEDASTRFVKWFVENVGVYVLPLSGFYGDASTALGNEFVRLTIVKKDETFELLEEKLKKWKSNDFR